MNRTVKLSLFSFLFNVVFATHHITFGIITKSWWLFTVGIYYTILSIVRFAVLQTNKGNHFITKLAGVMLMLLSLPLVGTVILSVVHGTAIAMHEIIMIAMATYSFTKITLAIINLFKARKSTSARIVTLRNISLSDACVSVFTLQRYMLVSFGDMPEADIYTFNAVIGAVICMIVFLLGLNLVRNKKILFNHLNE